VILSKKIRWAKHAAQTLQMRNLMQNPEKKRPIPVCRWEDNVEMDIKEPDSELEADSGISRYGAVAVSYRVTYGGETILPLMLSTLYIYLEAMPSKITGLFHYRYTTHILLL
jgi:hypothetical protein